MRSIAIGLVVLCVLSLMGVGEAQTHAGTDFWQSATECVDLALVRRVPDVVASLDAIARRDARHAPRCWHWSGRLELIAGRPAAAVEYFERAARRVGDVWGQRSVLAAAAWESERGRYHVASTQLARLLRTVSPGGEITPTQVQTALARVHLDAGFVGDALRHCAIARARAAAGQGDAKRSGAEQIELAVVEGRALEISGHRRLAIQRYFERLRDDPTGTATDSRIALALERTHDGPTELETLRRRVQPIARRGGPFCGAALLIEYLSLRTLIEKGNPIAVLTEMEGFDPVLFRGEEGPDWPLFAAARHLVAQGREGAYRVTVRHLRDRGYFTLGAYVLARIADPPSLEALYRLARSETTERDLLNITFAIARGPAAHAERLLRRLCADSSAAHPRHLRAAARLALQCVPRTTP